MPSSATTKKEVCAHEKSGNKKWKQNLQRIHGTEQTASMNHETAQEQTFFRQSALISKKEKEKYLVAPNVNEKDQLMWTSDMKGIFSVKSAYNKIRKKGNKADWSQWLWKPNVPKKNVTTAWKLISNVVAVDSNIQKKGRSTMIKQLWEATLIGTLVTLWKHKNLIVHEDKTCNFSLCTSMIRREVRNASLLVTGHSINCIVDLQTLNAWNLKPMLPKAPRIRSCWWTPLPIGTIKINRDGSSLGNPRNASLGASYRTSAGDFLLVIWRKIGVNTNYLAKVLAILESIEIAIRHEWKKIWVESDSSAVVVAFGLGDLP
ncbi:hypothetical protein IFM89_014724 [Coptis chinensis]|uniref:RNase H type-1 domain-containing protein n=1 Tax=Coptis chinensis TaxID=261450 RepID=A0A835LJD4_9MAGN|nr:hypothetical protein IFM89_014724 [Coptis chinensis]